jgi:two-component system response regulator HydG
MKKILIIDDEVNVGLLLSKFLVRNGFEVRYSYKWRQWHGIP